MAIKPKVDTQYIRDSAAAAATRPPTRARIAAAIAQPSNPVFVLPALEGCTLQITADSTALSSCAAARAVDAGIIGTLQERVGLLERAARPPRFTPYTELLWEARSGAIVGRGGLEVRTFWDLALAGAVDVSSAPVERGGGVRALVGVRKRF